ncbi:hypothetical protein [Streptomyces sp. H27-C3]|uniref:hypothetical protein n=1 Tax=Streptomyces sp. H27-C3 TaxID=3046305 RepID=UPI0024BA533C|nr:hypothetical protein [Streptomyces sp. H27-C3]MDJ0463462.1 hypothetical protein [Streptomyces sp. H27-C3]
MLDTHFFRNQRFIGAVACGLLTASRRTAPRFRNPRGRKRSSVAAMSSMPRVSMNVVSVRFSTRTRSEPDRASMIRAASAAVGASR